MDPIDELLARCLEQHESVWPAAVDTACAAHPEHAEELRRRFAHVQRMTVPGPPVPDRMPERLGEFRLLSRLGGGGMGVVYLAEQEPLGRRVALKLIRPDQLYFPGARERFQREVEGIALLQHSGIVPIYAVGEADGIPYFAMEHVPGASLDAVLRALPQIPAAKLTAAHLGAALEQAVGTPVTVAYVGSWTDACVRIVLQVAEALAHAHERGVLHRDIKPSNIMMTPTGECRLLDFGLAMAPGASRVTRTGAQLGSLPFMSPEQVESRFDQLDRRSDVYSLGVTLYELLTNSLPFQGATHSELVRAISGTDARDPRALNPQVSADQSAVVLKTLEKEPARRYASAFAFAEDLRALLDRRPVTARPIARLERAMRWARREPAWATVLLLVALGLPAVAALLGHAAATREVADVGRAKQRADQIESLLARGFTMVMASGGSASLAARAFRDVLAMDPGNLDALVGLGLVHMSAGGGEQTLAFLDRDARHLEGCAAFQRLRAMALRSLGREAEAQALRGTEAAPASLAERRLLAEIAVQECWYQGDKELVRDALARIAEVILLSREASFLLYARQAELASVLGDEPLVRRSVMALQSLWPEEPLLDFVVGSSIRPFDPRGAAAALERYVSRSPETGGLVNLSLALEGCDDLTGALARAEQAVAIEPRSWQARIRLAAVLRKLNRVPEAVAQLVAALQSRQMASVVGELTNLIQKSDLHEYPEAERAVIATAEKAPLAFQLQANVGAYLGTTRRPAEALPFLRRALDLRPDSVPVRVSLGCALHALGQLDAAEAELRKAIERDPQHFDAHYNLGVLFMQREDFEGAYREYRAALAIRDDPRARNNLGLLLVRSLGPEAAAAEFRRALELAPTLRPAHNNLLRQLRRLGDETGIAEEEARWERATSRPASRQ